LTSLKHLALLKLFVIPESRRRGIATQALSLVIKDCIAEGRTTIIGHSTTIGKEWCEKIGAEKVQSISRFKLRSDEINSHEIGKKTAQYHAKLNESIELAHYINGIPEEKLEEASRLMNIIWNLEPTEDANYGEIEITPEQLKEIYEFHEAVGSETWTIIAKNRANDELCGFTELQWDKKRPEIVNQRFTGVLPEYQGRGIGSYIKYEMLLKLREKEGQYEIITGNANVNDPMLRVNEKLGFKFYEKQYTWQIEINDFSKKRMNITE
ncbi:MAG: GNAT family N-acetyltransferase, partial [Candidatus Hodarchaeales archaeon]